MKEVIFKSKVKTIEVGGKIKYAPVIEIEGKDSFLTNNGVLIYYETPEEANIYLEQL